MYLIILKRYEKNQRMSYEIPIVGARSIDDLKALLMDSSFVNSYLLESRPMDFLAIVSLH